MASVDTIIQNIINQIKADDPAFSLEVGTPERKIVEAVATEIATAQGDFSVLDAQHDIDSMTGDRLDAFVNLMGFSRQQATAASGTVTFSKSSAALDDILIPFGTQVKASDADPNSLDVYFTTTQSSTLQQGTTSVDIPVIATTPGSMGNVAAGAVNGFATLTGVPSITNVTNDAPMTGGQDFEDDDALRIRFKNSIFRNMSGTYDQFMALALSGETTTKANVVGPISRYQEYIQVPTVDDTQQATTSTSPNGNWDPATVVYAHKRTSDASTIPYSKYTYADQFYLTDGTVGGTVFKPYHDFFFNRIPVNPTSNPRAAWTSRTVGGITTNPKALFQPNITFLNPTYPVFQTGINPGDIVLLEHAYMSKNSRNDIGRGIMNAVDVFVNGSKSKSVSSQEMFPPAANALQNSNSATWTYQNSPTTVNFRRILDGSPSTTTGNRLLPVYWQPMLTLPDKLTIKDSGGTTYTFYKAKYKNPADGEYYNVLNPDGTYSKIANYFETEEVNGYYGTTRARNGIEFRGKPTYGAGDTTTGTGPNANDSTFVGAQFNVKYTYDQNIRDLQAIMEKNKQVTTDVLVHRAKPRYFRFYITVMYLPGASVATTKALIDAQVSAFLQNHYYGATIQLSDVLQTIHNTPGVDNLRYTADVIPSSTAWATSTAYTLGQYVRPTNANLNGHIYQVTTAGTTSGSEPTWPTAQGATVSSGPVVFTEATSTHRIEEVNKDGSSFTTPVYWDNDFFLQDNELATAPDINVTIVRTRAQNTWSS